jgi:transposase
MFPVLNNRIWFYAEPIDFRKQMNGLIELVAGTLEKNPGSGDIFVFRSRKARQIKLLVWQTDGFWLCQKRIESGRFRFPDKQSRSIALSMEQLQWLLSGLSIVQAPPQIAAPECYF